MYSYGEIGYELEGSFNILRDAIDAAICLHADMGVNTIGIWDSDERLLIVVFEGDVFERQIKFQDIEKWL